MRRYSPYLLSGVMILIVWALVVFLVRWRPRPVLPFYLISGLGLIGLGFIVFRVFVRRDYRRNGQMGSLSAFLQLLIWGLCFSFPYVYNPPDWAWFWSHESPFSPLVRFIALISIGMGCVIVTIAMTGLGMDSTFGHADRLKQTGLYRVTRNPQIMGCTPVILGLALLWPSWYAVGWVVLFGAVIHMMVLTEEEHLRRVFGAKYGRYCAHVPRYLGWLRDVKPPGAKGP